MLIYIYGIIAVAASASLCIVFDWVKSIADAWIPLAAAAAVWIGAIIVHVLACVVLALTVNTKKPLVRKRCRFYYNFMIASLDAAVKLFRIRIHTEGMELIPDDSRFLFVSNHISNFDPIVTMLKLRSRELVFVTKRENIRIPVGGPIMYASGCIPLNRESSRDAIKTISDAINHIKSGYGAMGIYPEGGIKRTGMLNPFRNGAFRIAVKAACPIVVGLIENTDRIAHNLPLRATDVHLRILGVLSYDSISELSTQQIGDIVYDMMSAARNKE